MYSHNNSPRAILPARRHLLHGQRVITDQSSLDFKPKLTSNGLIRQTSGIMFHQKKANTMNSTFLNNSVKLSNFMDSPSLSNSRRQSCGQIILPQFKRISSEKKSTQLNSSSSQIVSPTRQEKYSGFQVTPLVRLTPVNKPTFHPREKQGVRIWVAPPDPLRAGKLSLSYVEPKESKDEDETLASSETACLEFLRKKRKLFNSGNSLISFTNEETISSETFTNKDENFFVNEEDHEHPSKKRKIIESSIASATEPVTSATATPIVNILKRPALRNDGGDDDASSRQDCDQNLETKRQKINHTSPLKIWDSIRNPIEVSHLSMKKYYERKTQATNFTMDNISINDSDSVRISRESSVCPEEEFLGNVKPKISPEVINCTTPAENLVTREGSVVYTPVDNTSEVGRQSRFGGSIRNRIATPQPGSSPFMKKSDQSIRQGLTWKDLNEDRKRYYSKLHSLFDKENADDDNNHSSKGGQSNDIQSDKVNLEVPPPTSNLLASSSNAVVVPDPLLVKSPAVSDTATSNINVQDSTKIVASTTVATSVPPAATNTTSVLSVQPQNSGKDSFVCKVSEKTDLTSIASTGFSFGLPFNSTSQIVDKVSGSLNNKESDGSKNVQHVQVEKSQPISQSVNPQSANPSMLSTSKAQNINLEKPTFQPSSFDFASGKVDTSGSAKPLFSFQQQNHQPAEAKISVNSFGSNSTVSSLSTSTPITASNIKTTATNIPINPFVSVPSSSFQFNNELNLKKSGFQDGLKQQENCSSALTSSSFTFQAGGNKNVVFGSGKESDKTHDFGSKSNILSLQTKNQPQNGFGIQKPNDILQPGLQFPDFNKSSVPAAQTAVSQFSTQLSSISNQTPLSSTSTQNSLPLAKSSVFTALNSHQQTSQNLSTFGSQQTQNNIFGKLQEIKPFSSGLMQSNNSTGFGKSQTPQSQTFALLKSSQSSDLMLNNQSTVTTSLPQSFAAFGKSNISQALETSKPPQNVMFGSSNLTQTSQSSQNSTFGMPNPSQKPFQSSQPTFGQSNSQLFGASNNLAFGTTIPSQSVASQNMTFASLQSSQTSVSGLSKMSSTSQNFDFGAANLSKTFGTSQPSKNLTFGTSQPSQNLTFGASQPSQNLTFGASQPSQNLMFGTSQPSQNLAFGTSNPSQSFGMSQPPQGFTFGASNPPQAFGVTQKEASQQNTAFTATQPTTSISLFANQQNTIFSKPKTDSLSQVQNNLFGHTSFQNPNGNTFSINSQQSSNQFQQNAPLNFSVNTTTQPSSSVPFKINNEPQVNNSSENKPFQFGGIGGSNLATPQNFASGTNNFTPDNKESGFQFAAPQSGQGFNFSAGGTNQAQTFTAGGTNQAQTFTAGGSFTMGTTNAAKTPLTASRTRRKLNKR